MSLQDQLRAKGLPLTVTQQEYNQLANLKDDIEQLEEKHPSLSWFNPDTLGQLGLLILKFKSVGTEDQFEQLKMNFLTALEINQKMLHTRVANDDSRLLFAIQKMLSILGPLLIDNLVLSLDSEIPRGSEVKDDAASTLYHHCESMLKIIWTKQHSEIICNLIRKDELQVHFKVLEEKHQSQSWFNSKYLEQLGKAILNLDEELGKKPGSIKQNKRFLNKIKDCYAGIIAIMRDSIVKKTLLDTQLTYLETTFKSIQEALKLILITPGVAVINNLIQSIHGTLDQLHFTHLINKIKLLTLNNATVEAKLAESNQNLIQARIQIQNQQKALDELNVRHAIELQQAVEQARSAVRNGVKLEVIPNGAGAAVHVAPLLATTDHDEIHAAEIITLVSDFIDSNRHQFLQNPLGGLFPALDLHIQHIYELKNQDKDATLKIVDLFAALSKLQNERSLKTLDEISSFKDAPFIQKFYSVVKHSLTGGKLKTTHGTTDAITYEAMLKILKAKLPLIDSSHSAMRHSRAYAQAGAAGRM